MSISNIQHKTITHPTTDNDVAEHANNSRIHIEIQGPQAQMTTDNIILARAVATRYFLIRQDYMQIDLDTPQEKEFDICSKMSAAIKETTELFRKTKLKIVFDKMEVARP